MKHSEAIVIYFNGEVVNSKSAVEKLAELENEAPWLHCVSISLAL